MNDPQRPIAPPTTTPPEPQPRWAMMDPASHLRLWFVAALGLTSDLWSKAWAFETLDWNNSRALINNFASLQLSLNPGALFGLGAGLAFVFVGASVLALMFVLYLFANSAASRRSMHVALGLVLAGALGNLYDRTRHEAFVLHFNDPPRRVVGTLVKEEPALYFVGDYPAGANARAYPRNEVAEAGPEPVVRDFIKIEAKIGGFSLWPWIFNLADAYLVIGVGILLLHFWFEKKPAPAPHDGADGQDPAAA